MRNVVFDLSMDENVAGYRFAGVEGEHNATLLTVTLPERMRKGSDAEYRFLFETAKGEAVFSMPVSQDEEGRVSVSLPRSLMEPPLLKAHVGCYVKEGEELVLVSKSAQMHLGIQKSVGEGGKEALSDGGRIPGLTVDSALSEVSSNPVENRVVARAIGDTGAALSEMGKKVLSGAEVNEAGELVLSLSGGKKLNLGNVMGPQGPKGEQGEKGPIGPEGPTSDTEVFANALKGNASGNPLRIDGVSPLLQKLQAYATSDQVSVGGAVMKKFGKNLFDVDANYRVEAEGELFCRLEDGRYWFGHGGKYWTSNYADCYIPANTTFTASIKNVELSDGDFTINSLGLRVLLGGSAVPIKFNEKDKVGDCYYITRTLSKPITRISLIFDQDLGSGHSVTFDSIQIELGSEVTEHQRYREPTGGIAFEDGCFDEILAEEDTTITLFAEDGICLHVTYNKDLNQAFEELYRAIAAIGATPVVIPEEI